MARLDMTASIATSCAALDTMNAVSHGLHTPVSCPMSKVPVEVLIAIAERTDQQTLCALSCVSKQFAVAAQDVLYRFVDLRPEHARHLDLRKEKNSGIAMLVWTLNQKPHLAAKIKTLWWWPQTRTVEHELEYPSFSHLSAPFITGRCIAVVEEKRLAAEVLSRLTSLQFMTLTAKDVGTCYKEYSQDPSYRTSLPIFHMMPLRRDQLAAIPALSQLSSLSLSHGQLDWVITTLPTLHTLCLGGEATVQFPRNGDLAPNIFFIIFESREKVEDGVLHERRNLLARLPNLRSVTLDSCMASGSNHNFPYRPESVIQSYLLDQWAHAVPGLLEAAPSVQHVVFTYGRHDGVALVVRPLPMLGGFTQLRKIQIAACYELHFEIECAGNLKKLLPPTIQELGITQTDYLFQATLKFHIVDWLKRLNKSDFPELKRVELVFSKIDKNPDCSSIPRNWSLSAQRLEAIGIRVKLTEK